MSEVPLHPSSATSARNFNIRGTGVPHLPENRTPLRPYRRPMTRVLEGGGCFLMGEVFLYPVSLMPPLGLEARGSLGELVGDHRDAPLQRQLGLLRGKGLGSAVYTGT